MKRKFWNWLKNEGERELRIEGTIADESWLDNEIDPKIFRNELNSGEGDITVWINSYGGDVFAASQIYTMLMEYKGEVTVKIDGIAASAASVIAMAGGSVEMSPTSMMMIHDPMTISIGNSEEMKTAIKMLDEVKESIISAYELKTGLTRDRISKMMSAETWMNAKKAQELGFADKILYEGGEVEDSGEGLIYSRMAVTNSFLDKIKRRTFGNQIEHKNIEINNKSKGMVKMDKLTLLDKRANLWEEMKSFHDSHTRKDGTLSDEDTATYDRMEADFDALTKNIERYEKRDQIDAQMNSLTSQPILTIPQKRTEIKTGRASDEYKQSALTAIRTNFRQVNNYLQEGTDALGGYLVPEEWDSRLIDTLGEENIMRKLGTTITTSGEHKINITAAKPTAAWVDEGESLIFSDINDTTFAQITLGAHKLHVGVKVTNELLYDNAFDLETYIVDQFGKAIASAEEDAFLTGSGANKPKGLFATDTSMAVATSGTSIASDDIINLIYQLKRPYRKNAVFIMNDSVIATIRKLKDSNQAYLWQPSYAAGEPDRLLGYPVYTSAYAPAIAAGAAVVAFGDMSYYYMADRGTRSFKELHELFMPNDMTGFLMIERVDGKLTLPEAVRILKIKG